MAISGASRSEISIYLNQMQPLTDLWSQVTRQAVSELTGMPMRRMMGAHIEHLQALYRGASALPVPAQCQRAHTAFLAAIGTTIDAYLATAEQRNDEAAFATFVGAMGAYNQWRVEVNRLMPSTAGSQLSA